MRTIAFFCVVLLGIGAGAQAQQLARRPKVELGVTAGVISAKPDDIDTPYSDNWYGEGRYAGSIAYYWTRNLKTEFEHQWSGEGSRYYQDVVRINGAVHPYPRETFHQLQQSSLRVVWQFRDNEWVHPYLSAGAVLDIERQHEYAPPIYQTGGREPLRVSNAVNSGKHTELRGGVTIGGGVKFYMSERAFFNTGLIGTYSKPARTVSVIAGFGIEF